jgi:pimeloyl-ACP methyl ester carboxylesterase
MPKLERTGHSAVALLLGLVLCARCRADELPMRSTATLFGQKIEYYDVGTGPVVVLLHGLGSSAKGDWGSCIMRLAKHHRVLAPDQLGFGASDKPFIDYGIQTWVDFLGEFLRTEKVEDFTLAGESLGGWIACQYTVQALGAQDGLSPSFRLPRPSRLILADAAGHRRLTENFKTGGPGLSLAGSRSFLSALFSDPALKTDEAVRARFALSMSKGDGWTINSLLSNRAIGAECIDDELGRVTVPTLVIWGAEDHFVPIEDGKDYAAKIPGARLVVVPGSGHAPMIEKPDAVLAAMEPFIDSK